jgi:hypothetical protein
MINNIGLEAHDDGYCKCWEAEKLDVDHASASYMQTIRPPSPGDSDSVT